MNFRESYCTCVFDNRNPKFYTGELSVIEIRNIFENLLVSHDYS